MDVKMQNQSIEINTLPSIQDLDKTPLAPHYPLVNLLSSLFIFAVLSLIAFIVSAQSIFEFDKGARTVLQYVPFVPLILGVLYCSYQWFADKAKFYSLRDRDISYFSGLFFKKLVIQPASRIQHIEVSQGPIERLAKLGNLQVYSAGSGMQTFAIPGLPIDLAHQLRQHLTTSLTAEPTESIRDD